MGKVYRGQRDDGTPVALKLLRRPRAGGPVAEIEGRLLSRLSHSRVVRVIEHLEDEGWRTW